MALGGIFWKSFLYKRPFLRIPIQMVYDRPALLATVEGKTALFHLDTGAGNDMAMNLDFLGLLQKKTVGPDITIFDVQGNTYLIHSYGVPKVDIHSFLVTNACVVEESPDFLFAGSRIRKNGPILLSQRDREERLSTIAGRVGPSVLRTIPCWFLDLQQGLLVAIRDLEKSVQRGDFSLEGFVEVPLEPISPHIVIVVDTPSGLLRMGIDTGADKSIIPPPDAYEEHRVLTMKPLVIGKARFEDVPFYTFRMTDRLPFEGVLGCDFLQKHPVYFDFSKNRVWIRL